MWTSDTGQKEVPAVHMQDSFWDRIQRVRNKELSILWRTFIIDSTNVFLLNAIPTVVSVSTFTAYILLGNILTAAKVRRRCSTTSNGAPRRRRSVLR